VVLAAAVPQSEQYFALTAMRPPHPEQNLVSPAETVAVIAEGFIACAIS